MEPEEEGHNNGPSGFSSLYTLWSSSSLLVDYHPPPASASTITSKPDAGYDDDDDDGKTIHSFRPIPKECTSDPGGGVSLADPVQLENDDRNEKRKSRKKKRKAAGNWMLLLLKLPFDCYRRHSQSLILENTASVARDHLANERTYLAWLRTSLSMISVGVAITQLYRLNEASSSSSSSSNRNNSGHPKLGRALGILFVGISLVFLYFGNARYFHAQNAMCKGFFPATRGSVVTASMAVLIMLLAMCVILILERDVY